MSLLMTIVLLQHFMLFVSRCCIKVYFMLCSLTEIVVNHSFIIIMSTYLIKFCTNHNFSQFSFSKIMVRWEMVNPVGNTCLGTNFLGFERTVRHFFLSIYRNLHNLALVIF